MARFIVRCVKPITNEPIDFWYDNMTSQVFDADNKEMEFNLSDKVKEFKPVAITSKDTPLGKSHEIKKLKIQLGLSCNYECTYCSQRFVPKADETNKDDVEPFLAQLPTWFESVDGTGVQVEFWGGEPLVYWKSLKPLAEGIKAKYPKAELLMVTNGTLLDEEKSDWLDKLDFKIGISHDGPGYHARGLDPFDDEDKLHNIIYLWTKLNPKGKISFNAMVHKNNLSRAAISAWFKEKLGFDALIGEGAFIDPYDEGGASLCLTEPAEHLESRNNSFKELRAGLGSNLGVTQNKINGFIDSIRNKQPATSVGQKCGMDRSDNIAVDLKGNVLTCQNVSAVATSFNGESHKIGNVANFADIKLNTSSHWSTRSECPNCPVLQICQGSCMFLHNEMWDLACDNAFSDNIPFFLAGWEMLTGAVPYYIEGPQKADRQDILGIVQGVPKAKKVFNIKAI